jgi:phosphoglycerol transferase MdoB-like AlkP superfamily enzyme
MTTQKKQKSLIIALVVSSILLPLAAWLLISILSPATDIAFDITIFLYALVWCGAILVSNFIYLGVIIAAIVLILVRARNISLGLAIFLLALSVFATAELIQFMLNYSGSLFALI